MQGKIEQIRTIATTAESLCLEVCKESVQGKDLNAGLISAAGETLQLLARLRNQIDRMENYLQKGQRI